MSKDGKTITFRNVTLTTSESVQVQRDLKLYNPYRGNYTVGSKPVRAFVTLRKHRPFVITIRINDKP